MATDNKSNLLQIKHLLLVMSGKGGVGKSTVAVQLALALVEKGNKVGVLDVDLCGPSIPHMFNITDSDVHQGTNGWIPVYPPNYSKLLSIMSIGFLLKEQNDPIVWRGPKKNAMIKQFLNDVMWGELDYLIIDTPPGTSDEHISTVENIKELNPDGAILITTPQAVSIADVRREVTFCRKVSLPIIGIIENMSGFVCPHCSECTNVFSSGGGQSLADQCHVTFLGTIPIDSSINSSLQSTAVTCTALSSIIELVHSQLRVKK